jgi:glucose/arabinose dehydrogenase
MKMAHNYRFFRSTFRFKDRYEMKKSLSSRLVFGLTGLLLVYAQGCNPPTKGTTKEKDRTKFGDNVRTTAFRTPEEERLGFTLPEGFEVTLFASEPDITKPMNMEFDDRGRLWVTQSSEYPLPAAPGKGTDRLTILEDTDGDGKADRFTPFNDKLNIPIGILPVSDGAIAFSIPNLTHYKDTNGDDKADQEQVVLGGFGHRDTHGMVNNLVRGFDGWIHAGHGFTNSSTIAGTDGDSITMVSGNTFRFLPDGSRVEQTTFGRVNPFGNAYDEMGYLYSVDCHSKPIYQLIFGAEYPHFGKKAPGIGFAPEMMSYELGSTAISGLVYYTGLQFPAEYRHSFFTGDVVTCQINRNTITHKGSTPVSKREADFLRSDDPWFRPVDMKVGPDGALYIADFYNRIIGHYEVDLKHPGRDRISGRIWKITYTGNKPHDNLTVKDWSKASLPELIAGLNHPQLNVRMKIADRLVDVWKEKAVDPIKQMMVAGNAEPKVFVQGLWILNRLRALPDDILKTALSSSSPLIQVHALRVLTERKPLSDSYHSIALQALSNPNPDVQRTAVALLGSFPNVANLAPLTGLYEKSSQEDTHLRYTIVLAIRNTLRNKAVMSAVASGNWTMPQLALLTKAMTDVPSPEAASFVLNQLRDDKLPEAQLVDYVAYISRYLPVSRLEETISFLRKKFADDYDTQFIMHRTVLAGIAQSGAVVSSQMQEWGTDLAKRYLSRVSEAADTWKTRSLDKPGENGLWFLADDLPSAGLQPFKMLVSQRAPVSVIYTTAFELPQSLHLTVYDNDLFGSETKMGISKNAVRIRLVGSGKIVAEYRANQKKPAGTSDLIKRATLNLGAHKGQRGYFEVVDSSKTGLIGFGKIEPAVLSIPTRSPVEITEQRVQAVEMAGKYKITSLEPALQKILEAKWMDYRVRMASADALVSLAPQKKHCFADGSF